MTRKKEERFWSQDKEFTDPQPYDIVIPIMGITGSGKSTFINTLMNGAVDLPVSDDVDPCTEVIQFVAVPHPKDPTHRIVFLDTPGLNSTKMPDAEVLERIASWLRKSYQNGMKLAGIIFMYEISQTRDLSLARSNLDHFEKLCGDRATQNVILATTKWSSPPSPLEIGREKELGSPQHWGRLLRRGSRMCRLEDASFEAAWTLVNLSLADAFTFDTEKIREDVQQMRDSLKKKSDGPRLIATLDELLRAQNTMAQELKRADGLNDVIWNQLVENDKRIRETLRQIATKVTLSQKVRSFFKVF